MSDDAFSDPLPQKLGAIIKAHPAYRRLVEVGPPDPEPEPWCAICRDKGFLRRDLAPGEPDFGKIVVCECRRPSLQQARMARLWQQAQAPAGYDHCTLESYPGDQILADELRGWLEGERWLTLSGEVGAGKTGETVALLRLFAERGLSVLFCNTPAMLRRVRATYGDKDGDSEAEVIDSLAQVDVLALDDVGKERLTPWAGELMYDVVNRRYLDNRRTIVTTNLDPVRLGEHLGQATYWRIFERSLWITMHGNLRARGRHR